MLQIFLLLLGIAIGQAYPLGFEADFISAWLTGGGVLATSLLYPLLGALIARRYMRWYLAGTGDLPALFASFFRWMLAYRFLLLVVFALQTYVLLWPVFVAHTLHLKGVILAERALDILPLPLMLFLSWVPLYRLDRVMRGSEWGRGAYLRFNTRLVIGPVVAMFGVFFLVQDAIDHLPRLVRLMDRYPWLQLLLMVGVLGVVFFLSPFLLRLAWGGKPLPPGPLRERLDALCARARFRVRDLLVWDTLGGRFANALLTGVCGGVRYVFFTRTLLDGLNEGEVEAVLGHEMGHARHRHLVWYLAMSLGLTLLPYGICGVLGVDGQSLAGGVLTVGFFVGFIAFFLLYVSRRFERQADLFSVKLLGGGAQLASALEKVSALNGSPRSAGSPTHGSIESRVHFLGGAEADPAVGERFERGLISLQAGIGAVFAGAVLLSVVAAIKDTRGGRDPDADRVQDLIDDGVALEKEGEVRAAARKFREATAIPPNRWRPWAGLGWCEEELGDTVAAERALDQALKLRPDDPGTRLEIRQALQRIRDNASR